MANSSWIDLPIDAGSKPVLKVFVEELGLYSGSVELTNFDMEHILWENFEKRGGGLVELDLGIGLCLESQKRGIKDEHQAALAALRLATYLVSDIARVVVLDPVTGAREGAEPQFEPKSRFRHFDKTSYRPPKLKKKPSEVSDYFVSREFSEKLVPILKSFIVGHAKTQSLLTEAGIGKSTIEKFLSLDLDETKENADSLSQIRGIVYAISKNEGLAAAFRSMIRNVNEDVLAGGNK